MTTSEIINFKVNGDRGLIFMPGIPYQMLKDSFGSMQFINLNTGDYLSAGFMEINYEGS
jgi:hypothetical protein